MFGRVAKREDPEVWSNAVMAVSFSEIGTAEPPGKAAGEEAALPAASTVPVANADDIAIPILINPTNVSNL